MLRACISAAIHVLSKYSVGCLYLPSLLSELRVVSVGCARVAVIYTFPVVTLRAMVTQSYMEVLLLPSLLLLLQSYGLAVSGVHELLFELRDHYTEVLMSSWLAVFQQVFQEDNYHPISVATQGEYQRITEVNVIEVVRIFFFIFNYLLNFSKIVLIIC